MSEGDRAGDERILVLAPVGRDAALIADALRSCGMTVEACADYDALLVELGRGAAAVVLTEEASEAGPLAPLRSRLSGQPRWSSLPVVLIVDEPDTVPPEVCGAGESWFNVLLLQRPMRAASLVSALHSALLDRRRQYAVRDLLGEVQTLNAALNQRVEERTAQVQQLTRELTQAETRERQRIAHVLHDDLQQILAAMRMKLDLAREAGPEVKGSTVDEVRELADQAIQTSRSLSVQLAPPVLQGNGLVPCLHWLGEHFGETLGLAVQVTASVGDEPLADQPEIRTLLFQIVRELLFNVSKHAGIDEAAIHVDQEGPNVVVQVSDTGAGFDPGQALGDGGGFGLGSIARRLELVGGGLEIDSAPGQGTRIQLRMPL